MAANEQDTELVRRAAAGDQAAYEALYAAHARCVAAYFLRCGFRQADADDLVQETFVRAFRSLHTFDGSRGGLRTWLGAIARNCARKRWSRRPEPDHFDPELAAEVLAGGDDPGNAVEQRDAESALLDCLAALPEELARIVRLRYVDGRTTRGIAAEVGIPEATIRLRLAEAHDQLRRCLTAKGASP